MKLKTYGWVFIKTRAFNFQTTISKLRRYFKKFPSFFYHTKRSLRKVKGLHKTYYHTEVMLHGPSLQKKNFMFTWTITLKNLYVMGRGRKRGAAKWEVTSGDIALWMRCALLWRKSKDSAICSKPCFTSNKPISYKTKTFVMQCLPPILIGTVEWWVRAQKHALLIGW